MTKRRTIDSHTRKQSRWATRKLNLQLEKEDEELLEELEREVEEPEDNHNQ